ncbi:hypothetical protein ES705_36606 [subsurface metagenome]
MSKVSTLKKIIEGYLEAGAGSVTLLMRFITESEEKKLSRWYVITREPSGFINFEKRKGVFDEDNGQLKIF